MYSNTERTTKFKKIKKKYLSLNCDDDDEENPSPILKGKKYSSFLIKMLEKPSYNKRISSNNINLFKKKGYSNISKTNYTERIRNNDELNTLSKNNSSYKRNISYNQRKKINKNIITYRKNNISPIKLQDNDNNYITIKIKNYKNKYNSANKNDKEKKNKNLKDRNVTILSKLYGYNKKYVFSKSNILQKKKHIFELDKYQKKILKISKRKLSREHLIKLYTDLQTIKTEAEMIKPLPPINYPALIVHSFKEVDCKEKHIPMISFDNKRLDEMDDYEKELFSIKKSYGIKRAKFVKNKRLNKILEILPENVANIIFKNKNKII